MSSATPAYPVEEIVQMMNCTMLPRMCSVTELQYKWPNRTVSDLLIPILSCYLPLPPSNGPIQCRALMKLER